MPTAGVCSSKKPGCYDVMDCTTAGAMAVIETVGCTLGTDRTNICVDVKSSIFQEIQHGFLCPIGSTLKYEY